MPSTNVTARQHKVLCDIRDAIAGDGPVLVPARVRDQVDSLLEKGLVVTAQPPRGSERLHVALSDEGKDLAPAGGGAVTPRTAAGTTFQVGDTAQVNNGLYEGYKGIVIEVSGDGKIVTICAMLYRTPTPLKFRNWMLDKIDPIPSLPRCT